MQLWDAVWMFDPFDICSSKDPFAQVICFMSIYKTIVCEERDVEATGVTAVPVHAVMALSLDRVRMGRMERSDREW